MVRVKYRSSALEARHERKRDIVFKRCGCTSEETGRQLAGECPRLFEPGHGSWYYAVQVTTVGGRKARYHRGGFATSEAAVTARHALGWTRPSECRPSMRAARTLASRSR